MPEHRDELELLLVGECLLERAGELVERDRAFHCLMRPLDERLGVRCG